MRTALPRRASCLALLAALGSTAWAGEGLNIDPDTTAFGPRWAARLNITSSTVPGALLADGSTSRPQALRLLGDYYLRPSALASGGGLRLTSGVFVGPRGALFGAVAPLSGPPGRVALGLQRQAAASPDATPENLLAWPYLGLGYSSASVREGWGFNADLGLAAQNAGALRLGRMFSQGVDELLRELRLRPVLQLGVSYAF